MIVYKATEECSAAGWRGLCEGGRVVGPRSHASVICLKIMCKVNVMCFLMNGRCVGLKKNAIYRSKTIICPENAQCPLLRNFC